MKAKLINETTILLDHSKWNEERTEYGLASELEGGYMEYIPSPKPDNELGKWPAVSYEIRDNVIYQEWIVDGED